MFSKIIRQNRLKMTDRQVALLRNIFQKSVLSVEPQQLIKSEVMVSSKDLWVKDKKYLLKKPVTVVGFGKAVLGMALQIEETLSSQMGRAIVSVPEGIFRDFPHLKQSGSRIEFIEGAKDNIPDANAMNAAQQIKDVAEDLIEDDLLLVLMSGGGSALLPLPKPPITLEEKQHLIRELGRKGGGLAQIAQPAKVVSLILSDVVGDSLDTIASGPTVQNGETPTDAINVLKKYLDYSTIPDSIRTVLEQSVGAPNFTNVTADNFIIGNNKIAAEAAVLAAHEIGFNSYIFSTDINGDVGKVSKYYVNLAKDLLKEGKKQLIVVGTGEPTVTVHGNGKGGRNQQLALQLAIDLKKEGVDGRVAFLSGGTDGIDGPTDAAGAIATTELISSCLDLNPSPQKFLDQNDSYNFWRTYNNGENLIKIGHTGTNVMDLHLLLIND